MAPTSILWFLLRVRQTPFAQNWRGKPLVSFAVIVSLIAATTTTKGLSVRSELDTNSYPAGIKISDDDFAQINLHRDPFHGEWNYEIHPRSSGHVIP